ncbi:MAG: TatD family hydrolase [Parcubacteria group bacterium]|jgi:TatD DNase family protein
MIDTHAHLDFPEFNEDREEVIARFFESGGKAIVNVGVDLERSRKSIEIAEKYDNVFASAGIHPEFFRNYELGIVNYEKEIKNLKSLAQHEKVVAIGEIGLDYFSHTDEIVTAAQKENQKKGFLAQIEIAKELSLPVIVHCREAWSNLYEIIKAQNTGCEIPATNFVLHCYSGEKKDTEKFLKLPNVFFSFSANITYPKPVERAEKMAGAVRMVPLSRMMLDSDSPLLAPQKFRGKRNEPVYVSCIAEKIAEIRGMDAGEVEKITDKNALEFFKMEKNRD